MDKVLYCCAGGLGDHLVLSTLPEELSLQGHKVYLSSENTYRNQDIFNLISLNPYISGISNHSRSAGHIYPVSNNIPAIEQAHEIRSDNKYPKIYYQPKYITELRERTILSLDYISCNYIEDVNIKVDELLFSLNIKRENILILKITKNIISYTDRYTDVIPIVKTITSSYKEYTISNLYDHCDVINSAKYYITLHSGGHTLASAINRNNTYCIMDESLRDTYERKNHIYENILYIW